MTASIVDKIDLLLKKINEYRPLNDDLVCQLKQYYRIGLTYSSNALEGNKLTETETKVVLEDGLTVAGKTLREHQEAIGHSKAFDRMYELVAQKTISQREAQDFHRLFYQQIDRDQAGVYRKVPVVISGSDTKFPLPLHVQECMDTFDSFCSTKRVGMHPTEFAARVHLEFIMIHPFIDGNGRTARLLTNLVLLQDGYPIVIIPLINRVAYIQALQVVPEDNGELFVQFMQECMYESCKEYVRLLEQTH